MNVFSLSSVVLVYLKGPFKKDGGVMAEINKVGELNTMRAYTGHGMIEHHPANLTIAGVFGHERGHLNEARSLALMTGDRIVSEKIEMDYAFVDGKLIATGGKATTVTAKEKQVSAYKNIKDFGAKKPSVPDNNKPPETEKPGNKVSDLNNNADKQLDSKADQLNQQLQQQKAKLDGELRKAEQQARDGSNSIQAMREPSSEEVYQPEERPAGEPKAADSDNGKRRAQARLNTLKEQISRVENMIKSLEIAKSLNMLSKLMDSVVAASTSVGMSLAQTSLGNIAASSNNSIPSSGSAEQPSAGGSGNTVSKLFENGPSKSEGGSLANVINMIEANLRGALVNIKV